MIKKLLIFIFLILILTSFAFLPVFKVNNIQIDQSAECVSAKQLEGLKEQKIYLVKSKNIEEKIKKESPCAQNVKISLSFPAKIVVKITTSGPVLKLENTALAITPYGQVVEAGTRELPILFFSKVVNFSKDQIITDPDILLSAKIASAIAKSDFVAGSIRPTDEGVAVYGQDNIFALFSKEKDIDIQTDSLQQVMARAKIDASKISKIDLRFDKPIIVYK